MGLRRRQAHPRRWKSAHRRLGRDGLGQSRLQRLRERRRADGAVQPARRDAQRSSSRERGSRRSSKAWGRSPAASRTTSTTSWGSRAGYAGALRRSRENGEKSAESLPRWKRRSSAARRRGSAPRLRPPGGDSTSSGPVDVNGVVREPRLDAPGNLPEGDRIFQSSFAPKLPPVPGDSAPAPGAPESLRQRARCHARRRKVSPFEPTSRRATPFAEGFRSRGRIGYVTVTVSDSGDGMSDEIRSRIFEPFFSTKKEQGGSGLARGGLRRDRIARRIHRGRERKREGVDFPDPAPDAEGQAGPAPAEKRSVRAGTPKNVARRLRRRRGCRRSRRRRVGRGDPRHRGRAGVAKFHEGTPWKAKASGCHRLRRQRKPCGSIASIRAGSASSFPDLQLPKLGGWNAFLRIRSAMRPPR